MDTGGPYSTPTYNGCKYFLTIVDDFTRITWTHLMGAKSNVFPLTKAFVAMVKTQFQTCFQTIRSDNALELGSGALVGQFFVDNGIVHQTSFPRTPQQNRVVERKHRHFLETSIVLLFQSKLPIKFWGDCILTATYLINRFPSKLLANKTPFELLFGKPPSNTHIRTFGCLYFFTIPKCHKDKFQTRADPCIFLGYPLAKKGYKLYNLASKLTFISRDVVFHEGIFPFASVSPSSITSTSSSSPVPFSSDEFHYTFPHEPDPVSSSTPVASASSSPIPSPVSVPHYTPVPEPAPAPPTAPSLSPAPLRRSTRNHVTPSHLQQYVCSLPPSLCGSSSSPFCSQSSVSTVGLEPQSYHQAASIPVWQEAMRKEFEALEANDT